MFTAVTSYPSSTPPVASLDSVLQPVPAVGPATTSQRRGSALRSFHVPPSHCRRRVFRWITCRARSFKCSPLREEEKNHLVKGMRFFCRSPVGSALHHLIKRAVILLNPVTRSHLVPSSASCEKRGCYTPVGASDFCAGVAGQGRCLLFLLLCLCCTGQRKGCQKQRNNKNRHRQSQCWDILLQSNDRKWR